ncbi:MAG: PaaI family thioesterase [Candidatus Sulfotelmatobacter sp.]
MPMSQEPHGHETRDLKLPKNNCFVCGPDNPEGMQLKFILDEDRQTFVCHFRLSKRYTGPPGHCHGGVIACILDDAMGKVNKLHHVVALTREMTVEYLKPVPLHTLLRVEGREIEVRGTKHINTAQILNENNEVLARSRGVFIAIDPDKMFAKFVER